jgi:hypothetical protein
MMIKWIQLLQLTVNFFQLAKLNFNFWFNFWFNF